MSTFKARGLVVNEMNIGESDKLVTLLLKETGKITVSARGARNAKSKFLAGTQLFTYSDFVIYDGGKFYSMAQIEVIESFYSIRNDYEAFCYGVYFLELYDKTILEGLPCDDLLQLLLKTLLVLSKQCYGKWLVCCAFELKFLQLNGFSPEFDLSNEMNHSSHTKLSKDASLAVSYILNSDVKDLYKFTVSEPVLSELKTASEVFMRCHLDLNVKSRKLIKDL